MKIENLTISIYHPARMSNKFVLKHIRCHLYIFYEIRINVQENIERCQL